MADDTRQSAEIHRMVMPDHVCPYGLKAKALLERKGLEVKDHWLETRAQTEAFQREHDVDTTPQVFIGGERIGGYDELREYFGKSVPKEGETSFQPVIAIFSVALLMALAASWAAFGRELKCACVGGNSNVPLGFVSLTENLMMVAMAIWMSL
jgi:glutaredoxin